MVVKNYEFHLETTAGTDMLDLTGQVQARLEQSGVRDGVLVVFVPGSTGALTTVEYESGVLSDLARAIERL
ncbi:MAG: YjbQ family protein, partial [Thermodesulfobacteriota bacterium]|nr:YjbQ family protein [Thermodesulfobacteriota bacterium]